MRKNSIIITLQLLLFCCHCFSQRTDVLSEDSIYLWAERGLTLYENENYIEAINSLKPVLESGQLDKPSYGGLAYYLCDSYYQISETFEDGSREKYETMKNCYQWMTEIDRKQYEEVDAADARRNVISAYVTSIHFYSCTLEDTATAIQLELEAMKLYETIAKDDLNMGVIKAHLHELYMEAKQWDDAIAMAKDVEKIVFDNGGKIGDLVRIYSNMAMIYNQKNDIQTSGTYANRVLTCMEHLEEDDLNYEERISYSMALYYLAINYQQVAKPVYYDYFKRAYYLIKSNDEIRNEPYFRELLLQLVITSRTLNDRDYTAKFIEELLALCEMYENPLGRIYNESWAYYLESLAEEDDDKVIQMFSDYITRWSEYNIFSNTDVCDFEEWSRDERISTFIHVLSTLVYEYSDQMRKEAPKQLQDIMTYLKGFGEDNKDACRLLSYIYYLQGDYLSCLTYGHNALKNDVLDIDADAFLLQLMAYSARNQKRYSALETYNGSLFFYDKMQLKRNFMNLTSEVRSNYWSQAESNFVAVISNALVCNTNKSLEVAFDASLCRKGILLSTDMGMARVVAESRDTCLQRMYSDLQMMHAARNELALKGDNRVARYLAVEADKLEAEVIHKAQQYKDMDKLLEFSWKDINHKLSAQEAAVEFEQYLNDDGILQYVALVLAKGKIHKIDLYTEEEMQALIKNNVYDDSSLAQKLWTPILSTVPGVRRLYFAPCGLLYNVAIESLRDDKGLVADNMTLVRLSSTRELLQSGKAKKMSSEAVLYGGLQYDMDIDEMVAMAKKSNTQRGSMATIEPLPATLDEVETIAATLSKSKISPSLYTEVRGTEQSFKELSGHAPRIIHIATHGFYNDKTNPNLLSLAGVAALERGINEEDLTLTRSGLLLAGAENILQGEDIPQNVDDGVLTAQEISTVNLHNLDLVTLSACDTGLGEISGDGVFGLQRGFKKAGANSILMSLWKVDDEATCKLMTEFYSNWIAKHMTKHDALEAAKKTVRETKGWEDPKYWAAFILLDGLD